MFPNVKFRVRAKRGEPGVLVEGKEPGSCSTSWSHETLTEKFPFLSLHLLLCGFLPSHSRTSGAAMNTGLGGSSMGFVNFTCISVSGRQEVLRS